MSSEDQVFDSWEDFEESGELDRRLDRISKSSREKDSSRDMKQPIPMEEPGRTAYQPQLRILKRPTTNAADASSQENKAPVRPIKTLEEREAAYAEARLRILGPESATDSNEAAKVSLQARPAAPNNVSDLSTQMERVHVSPETVIRQPKGPDGTRGFGQASCSTTTPTTKKNVRR